MTQYFYFKDEKLNGFSIDDNNRGHVAALYLNSDVVWMVENGKVTWLKTEPLSIQNTQDLVELSRKYVKILRATLASIGV